ncbi:MAG: N-succinyldiaminopimelate aminotransferase [Oleiphilaceae bacterium]|jgi:N-succinyldiaminopimelate aminotransferase
MNPDLNKLQPYPFEKLKSLFSKVTPNPELRPISLSIGEPKHPTPEIVLNELHKEIQKVAIYPSTKGIPELRQAISNWACKRFNLLSLDSESQILPVNGTREALFAFTQVVIDRTNKPLVISPNPFYQIYEGASYLAGADLHLLPTLETTNFIPDYDAVSEDVWKRCQILFICSPGNPSGAVTPIDTLKKLITLADKYDFVIASDECYSEIYCQEDNAPVSLLQACSELNRNDYARCVVFHSLSKRSNLPGLRSGFVAGDSQIMANFLKYRTYHGSAMPVHNQLASIVAWNDETHVLENRTAYRNKFKAVLEILQPVMNIKQTDASFYLWPETSISDEQFAQGLFKQEHVTVLPGSYLSRTFDGLNPGKNRIRMALVASEADCIEAAQRIKRFISRL